MSVHPNRVEWVRLADRADLAARLPALVTSALNDRNTDWRRAWLERELDDVWLLVAVGDTLDGFATFHPSRPPLLPQAVLTHVWLRRPRRRQGWLREAWPQWRERYGDFDVSAANDAMRAAVDAIGRERTS